MCTHDDQNRKTGQPAQNPAYTHIAQFFQLHSDQPPQTTHYNLPNEFSDEIWSAIKDVRLPKRLCENGCRLVLTFERKVR